MTVSSTRRRRIRRFSTFVAAICVILMILAPISVFLMGLFAPVEALAQTIGITLTASEAAEAGRLLYATTLLVSALPLSFGLIRLAACFRGFAADALFAAATIAGLRDFAAAILFWALAQPLFRTLGGLVLTWDAPPGERQLAVQLSSDTVFLGMFALSVLVVSWVLTEASALSEENAQFV